MTRDDLVRKLRDLRRLEQRLSGAGEGAPTELWCEFFSVTEGARVRYPFRMLQVFDRRSRERAFQEYLLALWVRTGAAGPIRSAHDQFLLDELGLTAAARDEDVRAAFRRLALELHPDLGGDEDLMRELIERYRRSSYGGSGPS
jgi:hypothetical protein